jgi:hypothetical protein
MVLELLKRSLSIQQEIIDTSVCVTNVYPCQE